MCKLSHRLFGEGTQLLKTSVLTPVYSRGSSLPCAEMLLVEIANDFSAPKHTDWAAETAGDKKQSWKEAGWFGFNNVLITFYHLSHVKTCPILQSKIQYSVSQR